MQCTGFYESGDALRNALFDLHLPLVGIVGVRSWLLPNSNDSAKRFMEPLVKAWGIDYRLIASEGEKPQLATFFQNCLRTQQPGIVLMAEGKG
jgi:hypothetical protein